MNEQKLIKYLASYKEWLMKNPSAANEVKQEQMEAQQKAHAFTKERLLSLSEDDLFEYLSPLWAMAMWGNKHYQIDNIIEANRIELLRKQFANLIYEDANIEKRWDDFRSKIKGIGPAIMSELLCKTIPHNIYFGIKRHTPDLRLLTLTISHAMRQDWTEKCMYSYPASDENCLQSPKNTTIMKSVIYWR